MFPYRDDNPTLRPPVVTIILIAANLAVWIVVQGMGVGDQMAASICDFSLVPADLLGTLHTGTFFPVSDVMSCVTGDGTSWHTIFTSMFLHGGWLHLLGNCWFLWLFGNNVEDAQGHFGFLFFYLFCGLVAAGAQVMMDQSSIVPMVGASGAISGVMGAYIVLYPRVRVHTLMFFLIIAFRWTVPAWAMLGYWFVMQLANSQLDAVGGVAVWAHIGGFVMGAAIAVLFRGMFLERRRQLWLAKRG